MSLDVIFAYVVGVLAGLAVVGVLVFVLVWEWCAIRRSLATDRHRPSGGTSPEDGQLMPTNPAEHQQIREGAHHVLADDSLGQLAWDWRSRNAGGRRRP